MRSLPLLLTSLALVACASATQPSNAEPPPIEQGLRRVAQNPACGQSYSVAQSPTPPEHRPAVLYRCAPRFPNELLREGISGSCATLLRAEPDGAAVPIETRCAVAGATGAYGEAWAVYAEAIFAAEAARSVASYRLSPADPARQDEERDRLMLVTHFAFEGEPILTRPPRFENAVELTSSPTGGGF